MDAKHTSTLWMIEEGTDLTGLSELVGKVDRIYTRGPLPHPLSLLSLQTIDVNSILAEGSKEELLRQMIESLGQGNHLIYFSTLPASVDQVALNLRQQVIPDLHRLTGKPVDLELPAETVKMLSDGLVMLDGASLKGRYYPSFSPSQTALIYAPSAAGDSGAFLRMLLQVYEKNHIVYSKSIEDDGTGWESLSIQDIDISHSALLLLPPRSPDSSLESFADVIAHLRAPNGCPWDRKQTHSSLRTYLLEETYEALSALDENDMPGLKEELGDLVLQILLHAQIGVEKDEFNLSQILEGINRKIIYRHPHVFGEVLVNNDVEVVQNWEKLKEKERAENGRHEEQGILNGVPLVFPALAQAQSIQDRAARVGFDWGDITPVKSKVMEELDEVYSAPDADHQAMELGDLLFAVVNLVRWYKVDAESALRGTNLKFRTRFAYIEKKAKEIGKNLSDMSLEEMDACWEEAKQFDS